MNFKELLKKEDATLSKKFPVLKKETKTLATQKTIDSSLKKEASAKLDPINFTKETKKCANTQENIESLIKTLNNLNVSHIEIASCIMQILGISIPLSYIAYIASNTAPNEEENHTTHIPSPIIINSLFLENSTNASVLYSNQIFCANTDINNLLIPLVGKTATIDELKPLLLSFSQPLVFLANSTNNKLTQQHIHAAFGKNTPIINTSRLTKNSLDKKNTMQKKKQPASKK